MTLARRHTAEADPERRADDREGAADTPRHESDLPRGGGRSMLPGDTAALCTSHVLQQQTLVTKPEMQMRDFFICFRSRRLRDAAKNTQHLKVVTCESAIGGK